MSDIKRECGEGKATEQADKTPAVIVRNYGSYLPVCTEIRIYDNDTDNLEVEEGVLFSGKWPDFQGTYTVPREKIREIFSMCEDPILFEDIEEKMPEDVMIMDGSVNELVICGKDRDTQLAYDNLWAYTSYLDTLPKAKVAYVIINTVTELADELTEPDRNH